MAAAIVQSLGVDYSQVLLLLGMVIAATWVVVRGGWGLPPLLSAILIFVLLFLLPLILGLNDVFDTLPEWSQNAGRLYLMVGLPAYMVVARFVFGPNKLWRAYWSKRGFELRMAANDNQVLEELKSFPGALSMLNPDARGSMTLNMAKSGIATRTGDDGKVGVVFLYLLATNAIACGVVIAWFDPDSEGVDESPGEGSSFTLVKPGIGKKLQGFGSDFTFQNPDYAKNFLVQSNGLGVTELEALLARPQVADQARELVRKGPVAVSYYGPGRPDGLRCTMTMRASGYMPQHSSRYDVKKLDTALDLFERIQERETT